MSASAPDPALITPRPRYERVLEIVSQAENAGGRRRFGVCRPQQHTFEVQPAGAKKPRLVQVNGSGCGEQGVQLSLDYRGPDGEHKTQAEVCVIDDGLAYWPRFSDGAQGRPLEA